MTATPSNMEQYLKRFDGNQKITGTGLDTTVTMPCPFCAAADFVSYRVIDVEQVMSRGAICRECGRGARAISHRRAGGASIEVVQTCGPEQPEWLSPKIRRVAEH